VLNVTATNTTGASYLSIWPTGSAQPVVSSLNWLPGATVPNLVVVELGTGGNVSIYNNAGRADVIIDVAGWFEPGGALFHSIEPERIQDSRPQSQVGDHDSPWGQFETRQVASPGFATSDDFAGSLLTNTTVTNTTASSYLTLFPDGPVPSASNLNWVPGQTVPNGAIAALDAYDDFSVYNNAGRADVIVDVFGWFDYQCRVVCAVSRASDGQIGSGNSFGSMWSPDGTHLAFSSNATNLTADNVNGTDPQVFIEDIETGATKLISTGPGGPADGATYALSYSPDGTKLLFRTWARNLVPNVGGQMRLAIEDLATGAIAPVDTDSNGNEPNGSFDGPAVWSPDGTEVAFVSSATNLLPSTSAADHVFVKTLASGLVQSPNPAGGSSAFPVWVSPSKLLYLGDGNTTSLLDLSSNLTTSLLVDASNVSVNPAGTAIAFESAHTYLVPGDTNNARDIFTMNLTSHAVTRVSTDSSGAQLTGMSEFPLWSPDGSRIAFSSQTGPSGAWHLWIKNVMTGARSQAIDTPRFAPNEGHVEVPVAWSPDGQELLFSTEDDGLVPGDDNQASDLFLKDRTGALILISGSEGGAVGDYLYAGGESAAFSPDGSMIAFDDPSGNLDPTDDNGLVDVFVRFLNGG
jgi:Tol biopolymer transport system component